MYPSYTKRSSRRQKKCVQQQLNGMRLVFEAWTIFHFVQDYRSSSSDIFNKTCQIPVVSYVLDSDENDFLEKGFLGIRAPHRRLDVFYLDQ